MAAILIVTADYDDGDYVSEVTEVGDDFDYERLKKVCEAIKTQEGYDSWPTCDMENNRDSKEDIYADLLTEEDIDWFDSYVPNAPHGVHTVTDITIYQYDKKEILL